LVLFWAINKAGLLRANKDAELFGLDIANDVQPRDCINEADSFKGVSIVTRSPTATFDPELELVATHPFWQYLATARRLEWRVRVGTEVGNTVRFVAPSFQYAGMTYADRNGLRVLEIDGRLSVNSDAGDDELLIAYN